MNGRTNDMDHTGKIHEQTYIRVRMHRHRADRTDTSATDHNDPELSTWKEALDRWWPEVEVCTNRSLTL